MGAAVFFHRNHISEFINEYFEDKNLLVSSVYNHLNNPLFLAGCRAFGIIDKICTGPLWRIIENTSHILDLNDVWLDFKENVEKYSSDSSELLQGKNVYNNFTNTDVVFESLFSVDDDELNVLTIEALQIILVNFLIIIERQLSEYLPGGKLNEHTEGVYGEQLRTESVTVSATNIVSERDFANLDRLQRDKPNANLITLEGMILFPNNKTLSWLNSLDSERKKYIFQSARQNAPEMLKLFQQRKETIKNKHISLLKVRKEEKVRKEKLKQLEMETLTKK